MKTDKMTPKAAKILVVDDDADFRWTLRSVLLENGYRVIESEDGTRALNCIRKENPDLVLLDYRMPGMDGLEVVDRIKDRLQVLPVIMITAYAEVEKAVKAMQTGVYDYVTKPVNNNDLLFTIKRALERQGLSEEVRRLKKLVTQQDSLHDLMGDSKPIRNLLRLVEKVAPTSFTVLIEGESGSGKELVARAIHNLSLVQDGPFIAVDCGAIPESLIESELFGFMKGAFTGAHQDKPGQFELAEGGTLFLDEVGNLPYPVQHKLLRTMEERHLQRLGAKKSRPIHVRIIAATNQSLERDMHAGTFRPDLYYRLSEFTVRIPPLRDRREDIPFLVNRFMTDAETELGKKCKGFSQEALNALIFFDWPGNVREIKNIVRQAVLLCDEKTLVGTGVLTLPPALPPPDKTTSAPLLSFSRDVGERSLKETLHSYTNVLEKSIIEDTIRKTGGNKSEAARRLAVDYKTLLRKIKALGIQ